MCGNVRVQWFVLKVHDEQEIDFVSASNKQTHSLLVSQQYFIMTHLPLPLVSLSLRTQLLDHWRLLGEIPLTHWSPPGNTDRNAMLDKSACPTKRQVRESERMK